MEKVYKRSSNQYLAGRENISNGERYHATRPRNQWMRRERKKGLPIRSQAIKLEKTFFGSNNHSTTPN